MAELSFGLYANPMANPAITTQAAYNDDDPGHAACYLAALDIGVQHVREAYHWSDFEPTTGTYDFAWLDRFVANTGTLPIILSITAVDGASRTVPSDLASTAWDASAMTTAYSAMLTQVASHVPSNRWLILIVGSEIDSYFATHSSEIAAFVTFVTDAKSAAQASLSASILTTCSCSFQNEASYSTYATIWAVCDLPAWTYYAIDYSNYTVVTPHTIATDFSTMYTTGGSKPSILIEEIGCPSDPTINGSESDQALFVAQAFVVAQDYANAGVNVYCSYAWMSDLSSAILDNLGLTGNFRAFYGSLGCRGVDGYDKNACMGYLRQDLGNVSAVPRLQALWPDD